MKCENCGKETDELFGVDSDMLIPFVGEWFEPFRHELIKKQVCISCCHGSKICEWNSEKEEWEFIYA